MAIKEFNCNKMKRSFWPFTLKDVLDENGNVVKKGTKLIVRMPQKGVFEAIKNIQEEGESEEGNADVAQVYSLLAAVLTNNMQKVRITPRDVEDYDIEECNTIFTAYMEFVDELKTNPN